MNPRRAWFVAVLAVCLSAIARRGAGDTIRLEDGRRIGGSLHGTASEGFRFVPDGGGTPLALETIKTVAFDGPGPDPSAARPPFAVLLGGGQRVSGPLDGVNEDTVRLESGPDGRAWSFERRGVQAVVQRPGEVLLLAEPFDRLNPERWTVSGRAAIAAKDDPGGPRGLLLPASGGAAAWRADEPIFAGRVEVRYHDDGRRVVRRRRVVELLFRSGGDPEPVQIILGWDSDVLTVRTRGEGPALAVQRLVRQPGRHRLVVGFGPERIDATLDGAELAHGEPPPGPLVGLRLAAEGDGPDPPEGLAARFEDLRVVLQTAPPAAVEVDPDQDEARLVNGDRLFGRVVAANREGVRFQVGDRLVGLRWDEVAGLYFQRAAATSAPVEGLWVRLSWRPAQDSAEPDALEGALTRLDDQTAQLKVPFLGEVGIPRRLLTELRVLGRMRRIVLDPTAHHLGNSTVPSLDPPQPEGRSLEIAFDLDAVPPGASFLGVTVVQVVGIEGDPDYSERVQRGELLTRVSLNGQAFDTLNRHITTRNETPARLRLPIPPGLLRPGRNFLRWDQEGLKEAPETLDNLGLWGVALESEPRAEAPAP